VQYPSPEVRSVLERTLGVPIFQEQVMQIAIVAAGFSPGEADALRRAMGAWKRSGGIDNFRDKLLEGMRANGYSDEFAQRIYQQMLGFGEYGFPESHAASFALLVYDSAWLKHFEPAAFTCALLNSQPMGFYAPAQLVRDARAHGVEVRPVDVCISAWDCALERCADGQPALRLGLRLVRSLSESGASRLVTARQQRQVNVIVWERVGNEQRRALVESRLLEVQGEWQRQEEVMHLIARRLIDRTRMLGELLTHSRDFH
jgi:error-prone DNA polymerase